MTMCMEAGPPLLDEMGRGSTKGQRNPTTSAVFILAASRYAQSNLVSFFFFVFFLFRPFFSPFWAICLFSRPLKQGCVLPGQPPGSMARFLRWPRPHHRPIGRKKKSCCCFAGWIVKCLYHNQTRVLHDGAGEGKKTVLVPFSSLQRGLPMYVLGVLPMFT